MRIVNLAAIAFVVLSLFVAAARADEQGVSAAPVPSAAAPSTAKLPQPPELSVRQRLQRAVDVSRELAAKGVPAGKAVFHEFAPPVEARRVDGMLLPRVEDAKVYAQVRPWQWRSPPQLATVWKKAPFDLEPWPARSDAPELRKLLADKEPAIRCLAVEALGTLGLHEDEARIRDMLTDLAEGPPLLDWNSVRTARYLSDEDLAIGGVYRNLSWQGQTVAGSARAALRRITGQNWVDQTRAFEKQLASTDVRQRLVAALNLADLGDATRREALVALIDALIAEARRSPNAEETAATVQQQLVTCLTHTVAGYGKGVVPSLIKPLREGTQRTRRILANVLIEIGPKARDGILLLATLANQPDEPELRATVIRALGSFGPAAAEAIPALERAAKDGPEDIRTLATEALRKIRQPAATAPTPPTTQPGLGQPAPTTAPPTQPPATQPSTQPSKRAAERAAILQTDLKTFMFGLDYLGEQDKPYSSLCLSVRAVLMAKPYLQITEAQATKIINHLATEGFLDKASESKGGRSPVERQGRHYRLTVRVGDQGGPVQYVQYEEWLSWDMKMLQRLDGLRTVLEGDAAKGMDALLGRLSGHREQWKKQVPTQPATRPEAISPERWEREMDKLRKAHFDLMGTADPTKLPPIDVLIAGMRNPAKQVRASAVGALAFVRSRADITKAVPVIQERLKDEDPYVRQLASHELDRLHDIIRPRQLKADIDRFRLSLWRFDGGTGVKHANLTLSVPDGQQDIDGSPFGGFRHKKEDETRTVVQINKEQAAKIIDHLAADGFLDRARVYGTPMEPCGFPGVTMSVSGPDKAVYFEELNWGLPMLDRLEALRAVLRNSGRPEGAMDDFLAPLRPHRRQWRQAAGLSAELPGSRLSVAQAAEIVTRTKRAPWIAVCRAMEDGAGSTDEIGTFEVAQWFQVVNTLAGNVDPSSAGTQTIHYKYVDTPEVWERAVRKGEQVIWITGMTKSRCFGEKALPDTLENRKAVVQAFAAAPPATQPSAAAGDGDGLKLQAVLGANAPAEFLPGQAIPFGMQLVNASRTRAYPVVKPGDGSESGWREPHVYYAAERLAADGRWTRLDPVPIGRCGLYDGNWQKDVVTLKPGDSLPLKDWLLPPSSAFEFQQAGRYRIRAHYAYRGGQAGKGAASRPADDLGGMKGVEPFEIVSAPIEIAVKRPLNVTLKVRRNLIADQPARLSDLLEIAVANDSDKPINAAQPTLSAEGRLALQMRAELGWPPTLDKQDNPHAARLDLQPGQSVSLLGKGTFANGLDGSWTYPRAGTVKVRAGYTPSTWKDIGTVWSNWGEVKVEPANALPATQPATLPTANP